MNSQDYKNLKSDHQALKEKVEDECYQKLLRTRSQQKTQSQMHLVMEELKIFAMSDPNFPVPVSEIRERIVEVTDYIWQKIQNDKNKKRQFWDMISQ